MGKKGKRHRKALARAEQSRLQMTSDKDLHMPLSYQSSGESSSSSSSSSSASAQSKKRPSHEQGCRQQQQPVYSSQPELYPLPLEFVPDRETDLDILSKHQSDLFCYLEMLSRQSVTGRCHEEERGSVRDQCMKYLPKLHGLAVQLHPLLCEPIRETEAFGNSLVVLMSLNIAYLRHLVGEYQVFDAHQWTPHQSLYEQALIYCDPDKPVCKYTMSDLILSIRCLKERYHSTHYSDHWSRYMHLLRLRTDEFYLSVMNQHVLDYVREGYVTNVSKSSDGGETMSAKGLEDMRMVNRNFIYCTACYFLETEFRWAFMMGKFPHVFQGSIRQPVDWLRDTFREHRIPTQVLDRWFDDEHGQYSQDPDMEERVRQWAVNDMVGVKDTLDMDFSTTLSKTTVSMLWRPGDYNKYRSLFSFLPASNAYSVYNLERMPGETSMYDDLLKKTPVHKYLHPDMIGAELYMVGLLKVFRDYFSHKTGEKWAAEFLVCDRDMVYNVNHYYERKWQRYTVWSVMGDTLLLDSEEHIAYHCRSMEEALYLWCACSLFRLPERSYMFGEKKHKMDFLFPLWEQWSNKEMHDTIKQHCTNLFQTSTSFQTRLQAVHDATMTQQNLHYYPI